jgi:hypothetical protein
MSKLLNNSLNIEENLERNREEAQEQIREENTKKISLKDYKYLKTKREGSRIYMYMVHKFNNNIIKINAFDF